MSKATTHIKRGLKIHSSEEAARKVVELVKSRLGDSYPAFFSTDLGKSIEAPLLCALLHEAGKNLTFPGSSKLRDLAGYGLEGASGDLMQIVAKFLGPIAGELGGLALTFADPEGVDESSQYDEFF